MKSIKISINFNTLNDAYIISQSLSPEIKKSIPSTQVEMHILNNQINLVIKSNQINTLRAACNSYLRWIQTALSVSNLNL